jgi:hypothetical protein
MHCFASTYCKMLWFQNQGPLLGLSVQLTNLLVLSVRYFSTWQHFTEPEYGLPCSRGPSACPYPKPDESSPCHSILFLVSQSYFLSYVLHTLQTKTWPNFMEIRQYPAQNPSILKLGYCLFHNGFLFGLLFNSDNGSKMFLRNAG